MRALYLCLGFFFLQQFSIHAQPVRVAVAGISHGHSGWILGRPVKDDITLVGVYEADNALRNKAAQSHKLEPSIVFNDLNTMLDKVKPEAVVAFGSIYDHLTVVQACAPRGIHVMVEKPLAVSVAHALEMEKLAKQYSIHLLTNYETSWYYTTEKSKQLLSNTAFIGPLRKAVFHHGHQGPREIGVSDDFFNWLTDPVQNGGGAIIDFGCYGANLMTWLMDGKQPDSITAITRQYKPDIYPKVDDEATIIINYNNTQAIIQASWNWPWNRKDMELYGVTGFIKTVDEKEMFVKQEKDKKPVAHLLSAKNVPVYTDPFLYLADVVRKKVTVPPNGLYSLENNMMVVKILEAAKQAAASGKTIKWPY